ncbi:hypothetical protein [Streptomyces sp. NPDC059009]
MNISWARHDLDHHPLPDMERGRYGKQRPERISRERGADREGFGAA